MPRDRCGVFLQVLRYVDPTMPQRKRHLTEHTPGVRQIGCTIIRTHVCHHQFVSVLNRLHHFVKALLLFPDPACFLIMLLQNPVNELVLALYALVDSRIYAGLGQCILVGHEFPISRSRAAFAFREHAKYLIGIHESQRVVLAGIGMVAAPGIRIKPFCDLCPQWVLVNVFEQSEEIRFTVAKDGLIPPLKEMANGAVLPVEVYGIGLIHALLDLGERYITGLDQEMDMVAHEDVGIYATAGTVFVDS